jgi:hypothetical protein
MASEIANQFNRVPNMSNLQRLATESREEALQVVESVAEALKTVGGADTFQAELSQVRGASDLASAIRSSPLLSAVFPDVEGADFASVVNQVQGPESIGWSASELPQVSVTGVARRDQQGRYTLNVDGREFGLIASPRLSNISPGVSAGWMEGFLHDGDDQMITIQGSVSADKRNLLVEGYMPGSSDQFVFGRVRVFDPGTGNYLEPFGNPPNREVRDRVMASGRVEIQTSRGSIEVTDPTLKRQLAHLPRLGVILPVAVSERDGRRVIDTNVPDYYALGGRFQSSPSQPATNLGNGRYSSPGAAAYDNYRGPFEASGEGARYRFENNGGQRNLLFGHFEENGEGGDFNNMVALYLSADLGEYGLNNESAVEETNPLQLLAATAEVARRRVNGDWLREMPAGPS